MSKSTHQIAVTGVDKTAKAFASIQARAIATGNRIASVMGGAIAAAGAYLSFRAIKGGIDELGTLSDLAMKAGTSVDTLTKSALAFQVAGLNLPVETLAKSFQYLKKNTGEGGMDNFYKVAESIAKIEDPAQRGAALVKNFGRAGMELQPLIDGGAEAIQNMRALTDLMPGVPQAAADAGDRASDALNTLGTGMKSMWLEIVGNIAQWLDEKIPGGMRAGALKALAWVKWFGKSAWATIDLIGAKIGNISGFVVQVFVPAVKLIGSSFKKAFDTVMQSLSYVGSAIGSVIMLSVDAVTKGPKTAWETFKGTWDAMNKDFAKNFKDTSEIDAAVEAIKREAQVFSNAQDEAGKKFTDALTNAAKERDDKLEKINSTDVNKLYDSLSGKGGKQVGEEIGTAAAKAATRITNQLITGGSNEARKLGMLGPQYQNEQKKQTDLLKKIADNTSKTADNTEEGYSATDL